MQVYVDTTNTSRTALRSGIPTVVRSLIAALVPRCELTPTRWSFKNSALTPLKPGWESNLDLPFERRFHLPLGSLFNPQHWDVWRRTYGISYKAPIHLHPRHAHDLKNSWLILAELMMGPNAEMATAYARKHGMRVAGIFYDAIPWTNPELIFVRSKKDHEDYMAAFAALDVVIPISEHAGEEFLRFAREKNLQKPNVRAVSLPSEIVGQPRRTTLKKPSDTVKILFVSTLEPRKNHLRLIDAFEDASKRLKDKKIELHLVGAVYDHTPEIADAVREAAENNPRLFWHERVGRDALPRFYEECDFTVYASSIEGFGLPVMESLWFGRPCICANAGVMGENAKGGGCLTVDMSSRASLADGIAKLAGDVEFRQALAEEALKRKLKTWQEYGDEILKLLREIGSGDQSRPIAIPSVAARSPGSSVFAGPP